MDPVFLATSWGTRVTDLHGAMHVPSGRRHLQRLDATKYCQTSLHTCAVRALFRFFVHTLDGACAKRSVSPLSARTPLQSRASLATVPACVACRLGPMQGCSSLVLPLSGAASSVSSTKLQFDKPARLNTAPGEARTEISCSAHRRRDPSTMQRSFNSGAWSCLHSQYAFELHASACMQQNVSATLQTPPAHSTPA